IAQTIREYSYDPLGWMLGIDGVFRKPTHLLNYARTLSWMESDLTIHKSQEKKCCDGVIEVAHRAAELIQRSSNKHSSNTTRNLVQPGSYRHISGKYANNNSACPVSRVRGALRCVFEFPGYQTSLSSGRLRRLPSEMPQSRRVSL